MTSRPKRLTPDVIYRHPEGAVYVKQKNNTTTASLMLFARDYITWGPTDTGELRPPDAKCDVDNEFIESGCTVNMVMLKDFTVPATKEWLNANKGDLARRFMVVPKEHALRLMAHGTELPVVKSPSEKSKKPKNKASKASSNVVKADPMVRLFGIRYPSNGHCNDVLVAQHRTSDNRVINEWIPERELLHKGHAEALIQLYDGINANRRVRAMTAAAQNDYTLLQMRRKRKRKKLSP